MLRLKAAPHQHLFILIVFAKANQRFVKLQHRAFHALLGRRVHPGIVRVHRQPGRAGGEAGGVFRRPLHRGAGVVPAPAGHPGQRLTGGETRRQRGVVFAVGVHVVHRVDGREHRVGHANLLPLIEEGQARQQHLHRRQRLLGPGVVCGLLGQVAAGAPGLVMVFDDVAQKAHARGPQGAVETAVPVVVRAGLFRVVPALGAAAPAGGGKVEHAGEKASLPDEQGQLGGVGVEHLAHGEGVVGGKGLVPQLAEIGVQPLP